MDNASLNLIRTKLHRPVVSGPLVHRPRLLHRLERGCDRPLTLVSAAAGSGKTTLLSDWLTISSCPNGWLSLDESDSNLADFLGYFVAAIRIVLPGTCDGTQAMLQAAELPPIQVLAGLLSNDLDSLRDHPALAGGRRFVLVLDDYHLISDQAVNELLSEVLRHPPLTMHLVLSTRSDPALPLTSLRARGQMVEIRQQDLRFTPKEARDYLQQATQQILSDDDLAALTEQTEGWITGLYLTVLNLRYVADTGAFVSSLQSNERLALDYLLDEVLSRQPRQIQEFLLKTSVLDRFCGPLCDVFTGEDDVGRDGQATLEWLEQANLFVVALDTQRQWYRYHHLFQQLLQKRLVQQAGPDKIADLHRRASAWYASQGFVREALTHALAAGDEAAAVRIVDAHRHQAMNEEQWQRLEAWLRLLPRRLVDERPELLLLEAWILQKQWRFGDIAPYVARIESRMQALSLPEPAGSYLQAEVDVLAAIVSYYALDGQRAFDLAGRALPALPLAYSNVRGQAWMFYAGGLQVLGNVEGARAALHEGLKEDRFHSNAFPARLLVGLCLIDWMTADLAGLKQTAAHLLRVARERNLVESIGWAHYFLACAAYQWNDLDGAESNFAAVMAQQYVMHSAPYSQSAFGLAMVYQVRGASDQAQAVIESVLAHSMDTNNTRILSDARACQAWLALKQGRPAEAHRWAQSLDPGAQIPPLTTFFIPAIPWAQALLDEGSPTSLRQASELLARLHRLVASQHITRFAIEVLALQAWLEDAVGNEQAALAVLQQAVALAQSCGAMRAFADLGPTTARLLDRLRQQGYAVDFVGRLLQAFSPNAVSGSGLPQPAPAQAAGLVEPLTNRELEIVDLLAERLGAMEIAQRLVISDRTVKRHLANVYRKLGVHGRQQAVATARALGLLP
jgi:LuxR family maltose regulon positive regulatory protein